MTNAGSDSISRYAINLDGSLTSLGAATTAGSQPAGVAMTPDGQHLFAANTGDDTISVFSVAADGTLTAVGSAISAGDGPSGSRSLRRRVSVRDECERRNGQWLEHWRGWFSHIARGRCSGRSRSAAIAVSPNGGVALVSTLGEHDQPIYRGIDGAIASAGVAATGLTGAMYVVDLAGWTARIRRRFLIDLCVPPVARGRAEPAIGIAGHDQRHPWGHRDHTQLGPEAKFDITEHRWDSPPSSRGADRATMTEPSRSGLGISATDPPARVQRRPTSIRRRGHTPSRSSSPTTNTARQPLRIRASRRRAPRDRSRRCRKP